MRIDVIGTVLCVVFQNEERRVVPIGAMRNGIHGASHRQVVVGDGG